MSSVLVSPELVNAVSGHVARIGSELGGAAGPALARTTTVASAAADEVSVAAAALFNDYGAQYQAIMARALEFHGGFAQALSAAATAYAQTEAAASGGLGANAVRAAFASPTPVGVSLIMAGTGTPTPSPLFVAHNYELFVAPHFTTSNLQGVTVPNQLAPFFGTLTLDQSVAEGVTALNTAIHQQIQLGNTPVNVYGVSQSAIVASLEMTNLSNAHVPTGDVNFVLFADPMNPNGGFLARFGTAETARAALGWVGAFLPDGVTFYGGTPANTGYQTYIYSTQYDGISDFPRYPIDGLADANAVAGLIYHGYGPTDSNVVTLSTSPGYNGGTTYYMVKTPGLPLLAPLRLIPFIGNPIADTLQPDLTALVNWGYGDPNYGWSTSPANLVTPYGGLPPLSDTLALGPLLVTGTEQGIQAGYSDLQAEAPRL